MAIELPRDFSEFLRLLNDRGVRYLVIGGLRWVIMAIHGRRMASTCG